MLPRRTQGWRRPSLHNTILRLAQPVSLFQACGTASGEIDCDKRDDLEQVAKKPCVMANSLQLLLMGSKSSALARQKLFFLSLHIANPFPPESFCKHDSGQVYPQEYLISLLKSKTGWYSNLTVPHLPRKMDVKTRSGTDFNLRLNTSKSDAPVVHHN